MYKLRDILIIILSAPVFPLNNAVCKVFLYKIVDLLMYRTTVPAIASSISSNLTCASLHRIFKSEEG